MWQHSQVCHLEKSQNTLNPILNSPPTNFLRKDKHERKTHSLSHETERLGVTFDYSTKTKHTLKVRKSWKRGKAQQFT